MNKNAVATLPITASVANQNFIFLVLAWICGIIVWFNPGVGVWFLLPVFLLWIVRGIKTHQFIQSSLLNLPGAVFMLTAIIGVWTAYDFQAAFHKFLILLAGIFIYIALAYLDQERIFWFFGLVSVTALLLAGYFLLSNDWAAIPADFDLINRLAERWMAVRAGLPPGFDNANIPAGILAVMLPLIAAFTWYAQANLRHHWRWIGWVSFSVVYFAIFMSSSRAVWMALAAGLAGWAWWEISNRAGHRLGWNPRKLFLMGISIVVAAGVFLLSYQASQFNSVASVLTGGSSAFIRSNLYHQTTDLIADFWLTGGGLQSFAGLYSKYILDIPYLFFKYAHNLWLDVALEQGLFGLLSFVAIYAWTSIQLLHFIVRSSQDLKSQQVILLSLLPALVVFLTHGFFDDSFYGIRGTPFLFILPGLIGSLKPQFTEDPAVIEKKSTPSGSKLTRLKPVWLACILIIVSGIIFSGLPDLKSAVQANIGAVKMAKIELAGFPINSIEDGLSGSDFDDVEEILYAALKNNPDQRTTNYCLGRIALQDGLYQEAVKYLTTAYQKDPYHTGIRKSLGFASVWTGDFERAYAMIQPYPEAVSELDSYRTWWKLNGMPVLSENAGQMADYLRTKK